MRIAKYIARSGVSSRRDAEKLILDGKVKINDELINHPAVFVKSDDIVKLDDKIIKPIKTTRLWLYNKPLGQITTYKDPQKRLTVFDAVAKKLPDVRVVSIGRLDLNSEGLLLLTNNSQLADFLSHPRNKITRIYKVRAFGKSEELEKFSNGELRANGETYNIGYLKQTKSGKTNAWYEIKLSEGKNREVRKIFAHFGLSVNRLIRMRYGNYSLSDLKSGELREVEVHEDYRREI